MTLTAWEPIPDNLLPPPEAEQAKQGEQTQLEWAVATGEQKQLKFVWHWELDPIKQQIDTCKREHKQKVQEIQAEVTEWRGKLGRGSLNWQKPKKKRVSAQTRSQLIVTGYEAQLDQINKQIKLAWDKKCNF